LGYIGLFLVQTVTLKASVSASASAGIFVPLVENVFEIASMYLTHVIRIVQKILKIKHGISYQKSREK
jgi:hypothetical protein